MAELPDRQRLAREVPPVTRSQARRMLKELAGYVALLCLVPLIVWLS